MTGIDLGQARRRAKELLEAARAGDASALARLPRRRDPVILADAQLAIARELGYSSWPNLVASATWQRARYEDVDWSGVRRLTVVPFIEELASAGTLRPLATILGYSDAIRATAFTGLHPDDLGYWMEYRFRPGRGPFDPFTRLVDYLEREAE